MAWAPFKHQRLYSFINEDRHNAWISERAGVTHVANVARGNFLKNTPHNFPASGLGQSISVMDLVGCGNGANLLAHVSNEGFL